MSFRTDKDTKDDAEFRFGPTVRVRDETSKASYNVSYNPVYEKFASWTEADAWSHFAHGALDYQLSDRTSLSFFRELPFRPVPSIAGRSSRTKTLAANDIDFVPNTEVRREDVYLNTASASVFHNFTAHTQGEFTVSHNFFDSERNNTSKNNAVSGFANVMHTLSRARSGGPWRRHNLAAVRRRSRPARKPTRSSSGSPAPGSTTSARTRSCRFRAARR